MLFEAIDHWLTLSVGMSVGTQPTPRGEEHWVATLTTAAKETSVSVYVSQYVNRVSVDILTKYQSTYRLRVSTDTRSTDALSTHDPGKLRPGALDLSCCNTHNLFVIE